MNYLRGLFYCTILPLNEPYNSCLVIINLEIARIKSSNSL